MCKLLFGILVVQLLLSTTSPFRIQTKRTKRFHEVGDRAVSSIGVSSIGGKFDKESNLTAYGKRQMFDSAGGSSKARSTRAHEMNSTGNLSLVALAFKQEKALSSVASRTITQHEASPRRQSGNALVQAEESAGVSPEQCMEKVAGSIPSGRRFSSYCKCKAPAILKPSATNKDDHQQCESQEFSAKSMKPKVCLCSDWSTTGGCLSEEMEGFQEMLPSFQEMLTVEQFIKHKDFPFAYDHTETNYIAWLAAHSSTDGANAVEQVADAILGCFGRTAANDEGLLDREVHHFFKMLHLNDPKDEMLEVSHHYFDPLDTANTPIRSVKQFVYHVAELVKRNPMVLAFVETTVYFEVTVRQRQGIEFHDTTQCPDLRRAVFYCYFLHVIAYALLTEQPKGPADPTATLTEQVERIFADRKEEVGKQHGFRGLYNLSQSLFEYAKLNSLELGLSPYKRQETLNTPLFACWDTVGVCSGGTQGYEFRWLGPFMNIREAVIEDSRPFRQCMDNAKAGDFLAQHPLIQDRVLPDLGIYASGQNEHFARVWSNEYNAWNLAFTSSSFKDFVMFWPKLLNPPTFGWYQQQGAKHRCFRPDVNAADTEECSMAGTYMLARMITLVTHIQYIIERREEHYKANGNIEGSNLTETQTWRSRWFSHAFGVINRVAAEQIEARLAEPNRSFGRIQETIDLASFKHSSLPSKMIVALRALGALDFPIMDTRLSVRIVA